MENQNASCMGDLSTNTTTCSPLPLADDLGREIEKAIGSSSRRLLEASEIARREMDSKANFHKLQNINMANVGLGGTGDGNFANSNPQHSPFTMIMENPALDPLDDDSDSDNENSRRGSRVQSPNMAPGQQLNSENMGGLKPGKKTKGRVKIKMEFIENKLRRYTTFSKRKTGIMKKAYELSTLTGTQVMLLVASETGHVYTFATRKLQPMITSDSGKNLIQTCLNTPENGDPVITTNSLDQRMNPTGFEEMELSYAVGDEEGKGTETKYILTNNSTYDTNTVATIDASTDRGTTTYYTTPSQPAFPTPTTYVPTDTTTTYVPLETAMTTVMNGMDRGEEILNLAAAPAGPATVSLLQQAQIATPQSTLSQPQTQLPTLYRAPTPSSTPILSIPGSAATALQQAANFVTNDLQAISQTSSQATSTTTVTPYTPSQPLMTPSIVMYQTPQGLVYATPTSGSLPTGSIFNFQQPAQSFSQPEQGTQYITIPMPVSLSGSSQLLQIAGKVEHQPPSDYLQVSAAKKPKK